MIEILRDRPGGPVLAPRETLGGKSHLHEESRVFPHGIGTPESVRGEAVDQTDELPAAAVASIRLGPDALHAWYVLGQCELARQRFPEALAFFQKAATISEDPITLSYVGHTYARAGNRAEAEKLLDILLAKGQVHYVIARSLLWIYIGLGQFDRAFDIMEQQFERRDGFLWWLRSVPWFDPLRSDPRFGALVQRMGFPAG